MALNPKCFVAIPCTDKKWDMEAKRAKELGQRDLGYGDPDANLCAVQSRHQQQGYQMAEISHNVYGFCLRDTNNNGAGRMSSNFAKYSDALEFAQQWHAERPAFREVLGIASEHKA